MSGALSVGSASGTRRPTEGFAYRQPFLVLALVGLLAGLFILAPGGVARLGFPALAAIVAGAMLLRGRLTLYVLFCVSLFVFTPLVRRMVDLRAGWETLNLLMLAPYAAAVFALGTFAYVLANGREVPGRSAFLIVIATTTFGLCVAIVLGKTFAGGYDYLRWVIPPAFALLVVCNPRHLHELSDQFVRLTVVVVPIIGIYGVYQFLRLPAWDVFWMQNAGMQSIGQPIPLQVRVFSTMNSPGSFSGYLMTALTILLVARTPLRWIGLAAGCLALALTLSRTAWLGFAIAAAVLVAFAPFRARLSVATLVGAAALALPLLLVVPEIYGAIEKRLDSFNYLSSDTSFNERSTDYRIFETQASELFLGQGLAVNGAYTSYAESGPVRFIDGGPIETVTALGLIGGLLYYGAIAALSARALLARPARPGDAGLLAACKATVVVGWALQVGGSSTIGEVGMFFWLALGILLAQGLTPDATSTKPRRASVPPNAEDQEGL